jgi:hypothetical protein
MKYPKHTKIVPVTYAGGTGGKFLTYLLNSAKISNYGPMKLSKHGNAHAIYDNDVVNMHTLPYTIEVPTNDQISELLNYINNDEMPIYCSCHILGIDELVKNFDKVIQICYDEEDIPDIAYAYTAKIGLDENNDDEINYLSNLVKSCARSNLKIITKFTYRYDLEPALLNVTWKELYQDDIDSLITKLSNFSNLSKDNFKKDQIIEWRILTHTGIEKVKALLGDSRKKIIIWKKEGNINYRMYLDSIAKYNIGY